MLLLDRLPGDGRAVAEAVAAELLASLERPFSIGGAELQVGASIGISLYPGDAADAADLLKHADAAMYQAKRAGRAGHALYRAEDDGADRRLELTTAPALRPPARRAGAALPARLRPARGAPRRRRGADPLERPRARDGLARRVHPAGRGHGADRADRRMGPGDRLPAAARVAGPRPRRRAGDQRLPARARAARLRPPPVRAHDRPRRPVPARWRSRSSSPRWSTPTPSRRCSRRSAAVGVRRGDRRLRRRLLLAHPPAQPDRPPAQARPHVPAQRAGGRPRRRRSSPPCSGWRCSSGSTS